MAMNLERQDNKFRVVTQGFSTKWLPDTFWNKKVVLVMLRYLVGDREKELFTLQELTVFLDSEDRQAVNQQLKLFRDCGEEFAAFLSRQCKVDERVVEAVKESLLVEPLAKAGNLAYHANELLGRQDIKEWNVKTALEKISCQEIRGILQKQIEEGKAHYREEYVIERLFEIALANGQDRPKKVTLNAAMIAGVQQASAPCGIPPQPKSMPREEAKALLSGKMSEQQLAAVWDSPLAWKLWALLLYLQGVSTAAIGGWLGVHKSSVCRWLDQVADWGSYCCKDKEIASSGKVAVDEKWLLIGGVFWYLFAAVDCITGCPLHVALYPSNSGVYCKLFLLELKRLGYRPTVIITDGWDAYVQAIKDVFPQAEHLYCRFHALQSLFRRLHKAYIFSTPVFNLVCNLFKSAYKRTVERRLDQLKILMAQLGASHVLSGLLAKWPKLIKTVGSLRLPSTANAVERFFGAFDRLYRIKGPFCDEESAQKHLRLFMLGYFLTIGQQGQACPLEKSGVDVGQIPLYHLLNRPNVVALKDRMAEQYRKKSA
jgi:transposase-like protein